MTPFDNTCWTNICTKPADIFDFASFKTAMDKAKEKFAEIGPLHPDHLYVREMPLTVPGALGHDPVGQMFGINVHVSKMLPATVKDGNDVELLGIMASDGLGDLFLDQGTGAAAKRVVLLTGKIVKAKEGF